MRPAGHQPGLGILPAGTYQGSRPGVDGADGPPVPEDPLLRLPEDEGLVTSTGPSGEPQSSPQADAVDGSLEAIYRRPNTSKPAPGHKVYPYLLKGVEVTRVNQVWAADITYIPMARGFLYLVAIMDWYSRYVLAWKLSNTMDVDFCVEALAEALGKGRPEVFNTDQGSQFTSEAFTGMLLGQGIQISMDGKGRYLDNIFVERLWRSIKYEEVYLKAYQNGSEARTGVGGYLEFYNQQRPHQALDYRTPAEMYLSEQIEKDAAALEAGLPSTVMIPNVTGAGDSLNLALRLS